jgi:hypothetical protein
VSGYLPPRPDQPAAGPTVPQSWVYEGKRYRVGAVDGHYGIWPREPAGAPPLELYPQDQWGWNAAWNRLRELEGATEDLPFWRRRGAGWVILNVALGFVFWFGLLFVDFVVLFASGHDASQQSDDPAIGAASLLVLAGAMTGWLLHSYLHASAKVRRIVLASVWAGVVIAGALILAPVYPRR